MDFAAVRRVLLREKCPVAVKARVVLRWLAGSETRAGMRWDGDGDGGGGGGAGAADGFWAEAGLVGRVLEWVREEKGPRKVIQVWGNGQVGLVERGEDGDLAVSLEQEVGQCVWEGLCRKETSIEVEALTRGGVFTREMEMSIVGAPEGWEWNVGVVELSLIHI